MALCMYKTSKKYFCSIFGLLLVEREQQLSSKRESLLPKYFLDVLYIAHHYSSDAFYLIAYVQNIQKILLQQTFAFL